MQWSDDTTSYPSNGPIDGFVDALKKESGLSFDVVDYREHAMGHGANASGGYLPDLRRSGMIHAADSFKSVVIDGALAGTIAGAIDAAVVVRRAALPLSAAPWSTSYPTTPPSCCWPTGEPSARLGAGALRPK